MTAQSSQMNDNRGRTPLIENKAELAKLLDEVQEGNKKLTHYMKHQLVENGYLTLNRINPTGGARGRPIEAPVLTGAARQLIGRYKGLAAIAAKRAA